MNNQLKLAALAAALTVFTSGCATYTGQTNDPNDPNRTQRGALIGAAIGWIQARRRFCMAYGLVGTFNLGPVGRDGALTRVVDPAALAADRRAALAIGAQGLVIGLVGALLFLFLPVSLG